MKRDEVPAWLVWGLVVAVSVLWLATLAMLVVVVL